MGLERYAEAEPLLVKTYEVRAAELGTGHANTLEAAHFLSALYEAWGKPDLAEEWRKRYQEKVGQGTMTTDPQALKRTISRRAANGLEGRSNPLAA